MKNIVFNIIIEDQYAEIQGSFFNAAAIKFFNLIEVGEIYSFKSYKIKESSKYNMTKNKLELKFTTKTQIEKLPGFIKIIEK